MKKTARKPMSATKYTWMVFGGFTLVYFALKTLSNR